MAHTMPRTSTEVLVEMGVTEEIARDGAYRAMPIYVDRLRSCSNDATFRTRLLPKRYSRY